MLGLSIKEKLKSKFKDIAKEAERAKIANKAINKNKILLRQFKSGKVSLEPTKLRETVSQLLRDLPKQRLAFGMIYKQAREQLEELESKKAKAQKYYVTKAYFNIAYSCYSGSLTEISNILKTLKREQDSLLKFEKTNDLSAFVKEFGEEVQSYIRMAKFLYAKAVDFQKLKNAEAVQTMEHYVDLGIPLLITFIWISLISIYVYAHEFDLGGLSSYVHDWDNKIKIVYNLTYFGILAVVVMYHGVIRGIMGKMRAVEDNLKQISKALS